MVTQILGTLLGHPAGRPGFLMSEQSSKFVPAPYIPFADCDPVAATVMYSNWSWSKYVNTPKNIQSSHFWNASRFAKSRAKRFEGEPLTDGSAHSSVPLQAFPAGSPTPTERDHKY
ncbi:hypothetical protein ZHAS_00005151 [Anopheles sinensis]|uniref:Uncharacterized protein n=1 Tax=Anopheles sinensis TaxID=74873 RepID=A0A084VJ34_ANOSI|nr:hypothetical protein ZHAS_00005151 [Anopheles sinensis]